MGNHTLPEEVVWLSELSGFGHAQEFFFIFAVGDIAAEFLKLRA
jgi:hypothetical protein